MSVIQPILFAAALMFLLATIHIALNFADTFVGLFNASTAPDVYFALPSMPLSIAKTSITIGSIIIGDAANLYRLWLVWDRAYRPIALPGILFLFSIGGFKFLYHVFRTY